MNALWMFLAGCGLLTYLLLKRSYRYFGRQPTETSSAALERQHRPSGIWDGAHRDSSALVERQQVELHEMARDLTGQLNTKIILLEQLVADSQRQIDRLEQLLAESKQAGKFDPGQSSQATFLGTASAPSAGSPKSDSA